jgi:hypothetical protein
MANVMSNKMVTPTKEVRTLGHGAQQINTITDFDCSSFNESFINNNSLISLFPVNSTEDQKNEVIKKQDYKNIQTVFVLCDTGHDGEYNETEENPLIVYTRNHGEQEMKNKIDGILRQLGLNQGGYFSLSNFPKNQEGIKKLETNLIKNMCIECKLPEVTDEIIQHNGLIQLTNKLPDTTFVVETFRKNEGENTETNPKLGRYSISNLFDCKISKIPIIDEFRITLENCILPNPFPKACSFLFDITKNDVVLDSIIDKTGKIVPNNYGDLISKIDGLINQIKQKNKIPESGLLVIIHIFNNTVGIQFGQVTANQVSSYVWGYNKRNGGNKDLKNIFTSMVISDDGDINERNCIATMGKQMGDLITIHALNTDPQKKILNRALLTLDRFCAILNVSMFGSSVFQSPKKIGQQDSTSVLSYIFKKNEDILKLFKINFVKFIKECKEKNLKVYITEKINKYINDNTQQNDELYKNWLIKLINKQNIDNHVLLINKKIDNLNQLCEFLKNGISEAQQNDLKMLIESYRYIDTIDKFIEREKIDLIINETNVKVDNIFTNIGRLSLYIIGYSNRAPPEEENNLIQAFGLILGQISDFSNLLLTYLPLPYEGSVIITNLFISYTIMINTERKMKQFLIYTLKNITETIQNIPGEDIRDYLDFIQPSSNDSNNLNNFDIIYNSVADNIISNKDNNYCTNLNERLNNVLVYMRNNNNSSPMFETNYAILRYLLRSIIFQKKINNENRIDVNISNITYDKVVHQDYGLMEQIYTNDIYTTPGKRAIIKSLTDQKNYLSSAKKLDLDVRSEEGNYTPSATSSATSSASTSPEKIVVKSEVEKNKEISFFGLVQLDFSYIPNFINQCGEYIVKTTNEAITNINDIITDFTNIGVEPTGLLLDRNTGTDNDEQMDIINETNEGVTSFQNDTRRYGVLRQRKKPDTSSDGTGQRKKQNTGSTTNNQQTLYKLRSTVGKSTVTKSTVTKDKTEGGSSKKPAVTRRKNKKIFKRKTMKKRKIPKRKNKTRRLRQRK